MLGTRCWGLSPSRAVLTVCVLGADSRPGVSVGRATAFPFWAASYLYTEPKTTDAVVLRLNQALWPPVP